MVESTDSHGSPSDAVDRFAQLWADAPEDADGSPGQLPMLIAQKRLVIRAERV